MPLHNVSIQPTVQLHAAFKINDLASFPAAGIGL